MDKIESKQMSHFKKGDAFVESTPHPLDDCPYGWDTLAKCGAKYMVIERPKK